jgi:hypothetical protein
MSRLLIIILGFSLVAFGFAPVATAALPDSAVAALKGEDPQPPQPPPPSDEPPAPTEPPTQPPPPTEPPTQPPPPTEPPTQPPPPTATPEPTQPPPPTETPVPTPTPEPTPEPTPTPAPLELKPAAKQAATLLHTTFRAAFRASWSQAGGGFSQLNRFLVNKLYRMQLEAKAFAFALRPNKPCSPTLKKVFAHIQKHAEKVDAALAGSAGNKVPPSGQTSAEVRELWSKTKEALGTVQQLIDGTPAN